MLGMMKCDKYVLLILHENRVLLQLTNVISLIFVGGKWIQIQGKVMYPKCYKKNSNEFEFLLFLGRLGSLGNIRNVMFGLNGSYGNTGCRVFKGGIQN